MIKRVYQTIDTKEYGNCLEACLASLLGDDIDNYPKINSGEKFPYWLKPINDYLRKKHKCYLLCLDADPIEDFYGYYIVVGDNKNATHSHAMIGRNGGIIFDPSGRDCIFESFKYMILVKYIS